MLRDHLAASGHELLDLGTDSAASPVDYPRFGHAVGEAVSAGRADRGVCVCGSGIGISIAANKVPGIRAAVVHDSTTATLARRHNDANVVCVGERTTGTAEAVDAVDAFVATGFDGGRHQRRIDQITGLEAGGAVPTHDQERQQPTP